MDSIARLVEVVRAGDYWAVTRLLPLLPGRRIPALPPQSGNVLQTAAFQKAYQPALHPLLLQSVQQIVSIQIRQNRKPSGKEEIAGSILFLFILLQALFLTNHFRRSHFFIPLETPADSFHHPGAISVILDCLNDDSVGQRLPRVFFSLNAAGFPDSQCNSSNGRLDIGTPDSSTPVCILSLSSVSLGHEAVPHAQCGPVLSRRSGQHSIPDFCTLWSS